MLKQKENRILLKNQQIKLKSKKTHKKLNDEIVGTHTIKAIIKYTPQRAVLLTLLANNKRLKKLHQAALMANIQVKFITFKQIKTLYQEDVVHQGAILTCKPFKYAIFNEQLEQNLNLIIILDSVQDSRNLGRASRSALCFNVDLIVIPKNRSAQVTVAAEKTAVGALSQIPVTQVTSLVKSINILKEKGFFVIGAEVDAELACYKHKFSKKIALVIGGENSGVRPLVQKTCDQMINIPMKKQDLNLNAADAVTVLLYEVSRQKNLS